MRRSGKSFLVWLWPITVVSLISGCFKGSGPARPTFDPKGSADKAIGLYDTNKDNSIDADEAEKSPGLREGFKRTDKDADKKLSVDEIAQRIAYFKNAGTIVVQGSTAIEYKGRPLPGATVTFEPEPFLGEEFQACSGITDEYGTASIVGPDPVYPGLYLGYYRVKVSKEVNGREMIPSKYNTETELGYEATDDIPMVADIIRFKLN